MHRFAAVSLLLQFGCSNRQNVECNENSNCDLSSGGVCLTASSGNHWCAYPDPNCSSGFRFSDFDVGDGVSGECAAATSDGGVDGSGMCKESIAFTRSDGLYVIRPDGTGILSLATGNKEASPVWSPDGTRVAFVRGDGSTVQQDIWAVNADGTGLANLTQGTTANDYLPVWSPDGTRIAFISQRGDGSQNDLWVMNADGSNPRMVDVKSVSPSWSADGSKLAYSSYKNVRFQVYVANADGTNSNNVSNSSFPDTDPVWSPDGSKIAFMGTRSTAAPQIYIMNADGSNQQTLAASLQVTAKPVWSKDSQRLAFNGSADTSQMDVYRVNADRTDLVNLTSGQMDDDQDPTWSGDGTHLAIQSHRDGNQEIYRVNVDGTGPLRLTMTNLFDEASPAWSPCK
jgi:Tol biopolymer transport system component